MRLHHSLVQSDASSSMYVCLSFLLMLIVYSFIFVIVVPFSYFFFFFQAEDGIRDYKVTGVQTCALPIFLTRSAYVFPQKTAVVHGSRRYSYAQLGERVHRLASALRGAGMKKHDRVAFLCPNIPAMLEAHFGVPAAGGILVAVNTRLGSGEIGYILKHSGSRVLFVDHELEGLVKPADLTGVRVVRVADTGAVGDPYGAFLATGPPEPGGRRGRHQG